MFFVCCLPLKKKRNSIDTTKKKQRMVSYKCRFHLFHWFLEFEVSCSWHPRRISAKNSPFCVMVSCVLRGSGDQKEFRRRRIGLWEGPAGRCLTCSAGERSEFHWILQPEIDISFHIFQSQWSKNTSQCFFVLRHLVGEGISCHYFKNGGSFLNDDIFFYTTDKPETSKPTY